MMWAVKGVHADDPSLEQWLKAGWEPFAATFDTTADVSSAYRPETLWLRKQRDGMGRV